jgi:RNA polymerase sigma factor (sigma-70 family)
MDMKDNPLSTESEPSLETRQSLLGRLHLWDDNESWRAFFELYWRLIYNTARRSGLDDSSAQDIVQETVISVARKMPGFQYDRERGSFKQWLLRITRRRIVDYLRKTYRQPPRADITLEMLEDEEAQTEAVADPATASIDSAWDEEWGRMLFDAAIACVRVEANPKHFQVFDYCVLKGWPAAKVAATLGLNAAQVYLAKHRVCQAVKRAVRRITEERSRVELR